MSLLHKLIATIRSDRSRQTTEEFVPTTPAPNCLTAGAALVDRRVNGVTGDEKTTKQRRYYVKTGLYVDHEEEVLASCSASAQMVIFDKPLMDLKSLFPGLSLR